MGVVDDQLFVARIQDPANHPRIRDDLQQAIAAAGADDDRLTSRRDDGQQLKAAFSVSGATPDFRVIIECGEGRNRTECPQALELLLARLAETGAELVVVVQRRRDTEAALKFLKRLLHNQAVEPETITTDGLASYGAALDLLQLRHLHRPGRLQDNNCVENSHLPIRRREQQQQQFKSQASTQRFLTTHAAIYNTFNLQRHLISRRTLRCFRADADAAWVIAVA